MNDSDNEIARMRTEITHSKAETLACIDQRNTCMKAQVSSAPSPIVDTLIKVGIGAALGLATAFALRL